MINRVIPSLRSAPDGTAQVPWIGAAMMLAGCAVLTVNDALIKLLVSTHPVGQVVTLRAFVGLALMGLLAASWGGRETLVPRKPRNAAILTALMCIGLFVFPLCLVYIPLGDAIMLTYLSPVMVAIVSPFVLGEQVGWRRWGAVCLGLTGAGLVIWPEGGTWRLVILLPVLVAASIAARDLLSARFLQGENVFALVTVSHLGAGILGLSSLALGWSAFSLTDWLLLIASASALTLSQVLMVSAFRYAEATVLACLKYTSIVWAVALGWMLFGERLTLIDLMGAVLIAVSGVVILQRQKARAARQDARPTDGDQTRP